MRRPLREPRGPTPRSDSTRQLVFAHASALQTTTLACADKQIEGGKGHQMTVGALAQTTL